MRATVNHLHRSNQVNEDIYSEYAIPQWSSRLYSKKPTRAELEELVMSTRYEF